MGAKQLDLIGMRYNMLMVVEKLPSRAYGEKGKYYKKRMWLCKCDCGNTTEINTGALTSGKTKSCGCLTGTKSAQNSINSRHKIAKQDAGYRSIYSSYKGNARSRKLNFNVDFDYAVSIMKSNCHYCGIEPSNIYMKSYYNTTYNGIDRVDNTKGYENYNVVSCCKMCNIAKNNNTEQEFLAWISRTYHCQNNKMIVREEDNRLELVHRFMKALNINMDSTFQIAGKDGYLLEVKVSDVFNNL